MLAAVLIPVIVVGMVVVGYVTEAPLIARFHISEPSMNALAEELRDEAGSDVLHTNGRTCVPFYCFSKVSRIGERVEFSLADRPWEDIPGTFIRFDHAAEGGQLAPTAGNIDLGGGWYYVRPLPV